MIESNEAIRLYELKIRVREELGSILSENSKKKASRDPHSRRKPRPCGITIHPGHGCVFGCIYCYVPDMGFPSSEVKPYPLSSLELVYALSLNPYVVPERTLAAYGSVTEPLLPKLVDKTLSYIRDVWKWLRLPSQISTKEIISEDIAKKLKDYEPRISILITIISINKSKILEPRAPDPLLRLKGAKVATNLGLRVDLFLRPIIPGITDKEYMDILKLAVSHGVKGVVTGSLRVTQGIIDRLKKSGIGINTIVSRLVRNPRSKSDQVPISTSDIKLRVDEYARRLGMDVMQSACAANILSHGMSCRLCSFGSCGMKFYKPSERELREFLEYLGVKVVELVNGDNEFNILIKKSREFSTTWLKYYLSEVYKMKFKVIEE